MKETLKYSKACDLFAKEPLWQAVQDEDRQEIFKDAMEFVTYRDKDRKREVRKRNIAALAEILQAMEHISYKTTWAQAQRLLIENPQFADDKTLQSMDKEDALIVFEEHIKTAEKEYDNEKQMEERRIKRQERKVREAFQQLLQELHKKGELTSMSLWTSLYPIISTDSRFDHMLHQNGSTPLDLFKFYVEELKAQYGEDRRKIKDILQHSGHVVKADTPYDDFADWISSDEKGCLIDHGNMKLYYHSLIEKAEIKEKKTRRKRNMLRAQNVDVNSEWSVVKSKIEKEKAYLFLENDETRERCFEDYKISLSESCGHHHSSKKKKKDKKKKSKRSDRESESEGEIREKRKKKKHSKDRSDDEERVSKKKKSRKRSRSPSSARSRSPEEKRRKVDSDSE
ncbi:unnamed protein product [Caenorhabditis auriculariae]|uniref:FF domain-containing protein n=1 Tax=Caenorhabditis auriculariae TaxID=2777116 RepID=A0A8S1GX07_9PELO|nr:unnamed protein product [Caenorhabditis auriculariae]